MMAGKRKVQDLQFFTEVAAQTEDRSRRRAARAVRKGRMGSALMGSLQITVF